MVRHIGTTFIIRVTVSHIWLIHHFHHLHTDTDRQTGRQTDRQRQ